MKNEKVPGSRRVLVLGATGFVGSRLVKELAREKIRLRLLVRDPDKASKLIPPNADLEITQGDVLKNEGVKESLRNVKVAYYLIHSLGGKTITKNVEFAQKDRTAAQNFIKEADAAGLERVIYLGGLGEVGRGLSEHLRSRIEVAKILSSRRVKTTFLRAAVIIGAGGASFEMLRYLVERLPIMICPRWIDTQIQPIAIRDVIKYLIGCVKNPETTGQQYDICGPEVLTYRKMMDYYAEARGLRPRRIISIPLLTPQLSAYWVDLITPVPSGIAHPLIEGLKNKVICKDNKIQECIPIQTTPFKEAVNIALREETEGPGANAHA